MLRGPSDARRRAGRGLLQVQGEEGGAAVKAPQAAQAASIDSERAVAEKNLRRKRLKALKKLEDMGKELTPSIDVQELPRPPWMDEFVEWGMEHEEFSSEGPKKRPKKGKGGTHSLQSALKGKGQFWLKACGRQAFRRDSAGQLESYLNDEDIGQLLKIIFGPKDQSFNVDMEYSVIMRGCSQPGIAGVKLCWDHWRRKDATNAEIDGGPPTWWKMLRYQLFEVLLTRMVQQMAPRKRSADGIATRAESAKDKRTSAQGLQTKKPKLASQPASPPTWMDEFVASWGILDIDIGIEEILADTASLLDGPVRSTSKHGAGSILSTISVSVSGARLMDERVLPKLAEILLKVAAARFRARSFEVDLARCKVRAGALSCASGLARGRAHVISSALAPLRASAPPGRRDAHTYAHARTYTYGTCACRPRLPVG